MTAGVTFVVPVKDGAPFLDATLDAIAAERRRAELAGRPVEVLVVDDASRDGSRRILEARAARGEIELLDGAGRGASAALNQALARARHPLVAQVDQDVEILPGWLEALAARLDEPRVAAAQGWYRTDRRASPWARLMGVDLEQRYARLGSDVDHVCTGNSIYRASSLREVGTFDEALGYGADVDLSYRLRRAGHRLVLVPEAASHHAWRTGLPGYVRQQYGFGYGRLEVLARHPGRAGGDDVAPTLMMLHAPAMLVALAAGVGALVAAILGLPAAIAAAVALAIVALLALERLVAGLRAWRRFREPAALLFPVAHVLRDLAWCAAILAWGARRLTGRRSIPRHSMG